MESKKEDYMMYGVLNCDLNTSDIYIISNTQLEIIINNHPKLTISGRHNIDDYIKCLNHSEKLELLSVGVFKLSDEFLEKFREGDDFEDDFDDKDDLPEWMK